MSSWRWDGFVLDDGNATSLWPKNILFLFVKVIMRYVSESIIVTKLGKQFIRNEVKSEYLAIDCDNFFDLLFCNNKLITFRYSLFCLNVVK